MTHIPWPGIESFHAVRKCLQVYPHLLGGRTTVQYRPKVKLHGTNSAVQVRNGTVTAQSREQLVRVGDDNGGNCGFAAWVETVKDHFIAAADGEDWIYFGEWCGPGILRGVAVNKIPNKIFAVFAAHRLPVEDDSDLVVSPLALETVLAGIPDVYVLPWFELPLSIPLLEEAETVQPILDTINAAVARVEARDPWVYETFGVDGIGEGLVYYPISHCTRKQFSDLVFKAKGEKHKTVAKAAPAQLDPETAASLTAFAEMVLTEARLEQGARAAGSGELVFDKKLIGPFLAWISKDVQKETTAELEASKLVWKQVAAAISTKAREWYLTQTEKL